MGSLHSSPYLERERENELYYACQNVGWGPHFKTPLETAAATAVFISRSWESDRSWTAPPPSAHGKGEGFWQCSGLPNAPIPCGTESPGHRRIYTAGRTAFEIEKIYTILFRRGNHLNEQSLCFGFVELLLNLINSTGKSGVVAKSDIIRCFSGLRCSCDGKTVK